MIKIVQPNENDNGYKYEFSINGEKGTGYLTYNLMGNLKNRTLLLTRKTNIIQDKKVKNSFEILIEHIKTNKNKGAFSTAKGLVNNIFNKRINIPNVSIAIHRFGPIPVCILPEVFELEFNGEKRNCNIGIYPNINGNVPKNGLYHSLFSKIEFLQSLKIHFEVIIKRYLEDVAENFFDIENHSDLPSAIKKAKSSESILSESITTKIDLMTSSTKGHQSHFFYEISKLKRDLVKNHSETIFKAKYAKYYAYYFINELYKSIGFSSKDFKKKFRILKSNETNYNDQINNDPDLILLRKSITNYDTGMGNETIEQNLVAQTSTLWVKRFIQFSSFIHYQNKENTLNPHTTKIFLSNRFTEPNSQTLKIKLEELINEFFLNRVDLLAVKENNAGKFINEIVKSRIWLSNATYSAIPNEMSSHKTSFNWLAKEAIYSESLKNQLLFILNKEQGESIIESFKKYVVQLDDYLAPEARNIETSKVNIVKKLESKLHAEYDSTEINDAVFKESLIEDIKGLIEFKVINIIEAWLNQFSNENASLILEMNLKLKNPSRISNAAKCVFGTNSEDNKKKFRKVWTHIKKRRLIIDGKEYKLIQSNGNSSATTYKQNLPFIIKALMGSNDNLLKLLNRCYNLRGF